MYVECMWACVCVCVFVECMCINVGVCTSVCVFCIVMYMCVCVCVCMYLIILLSFFSPVATSSTTPAVATVSVRAPPPEGYNRPTEELPRPDSKNR